MQQPMIAQRTMPFPPGRGRFRERERQAGEDPLQSMFIRNVAHEFRTPLGIVLGYTELLGDEELGALHPDQKQALSIITNHLHGLRKMVDRISILMAIETKSSAIAPLSLAEIVKRVVERKRADALQSEIELAAKLEADLPLVLGDAHQLEQAVESLIENALKFTPGGGNVKVEVYAGSGCVCLAVADSGIGISSQELEWIFAPFYQVDGSTRRRYGGLGLGLTLIKAVVEAHGGWVEADSQLDQGSQFVIRLPACGTMPDRIGQANEWRQ